MSSDDEDNPPLLVDVEAKGEGAVEEPPLIKVPITIVTGKSTRVFDGMFCVNMVFRVSRCWKDNSTKLHIE